MMCGNLFRLHLAASFINRRSIILRIGVSALFAIPFILVDMPARAQASGIVMVILFTGLFGSFRCCREPCASANRPSS
jgi:hypothetical protein